MIRGGRWTGWAALCSSIPGGLGGVLAGLGLAATGLVCTGLAATGPAGIGLAAASPPTPALRLSALPTSACGSVSAYSGLAATGPAHLGLRHRPCPPRLVATGPAYLGLRQRLRLLRLCGYWPRLPRLAAAAPPASPAPASFSRNPASCGISNDVFRHNKVREC